MLRHSIAHEVTTMLASYTSRLREDRAWIREHGTFRLEHLAYRQKNIRRMLATRRRLRKLVKNYASFRGEHPDARMPPERMRRAR